MAETEISTPVETTADVTTSTEEVSTPVETTSEEEVTSEETTAETGNTEQAEEPKEEHLYAGKYKSIEELEKGYNEAQKTLTQNLQIKSKYEELLKQQERQEALRLERAKEQGFNSADELQIAKQVAQAELNEFYNSAPYLVPEENRMEVQQFLNAYYNTGDARYLNEAKRYFPADFLENVAVGKRDMEQRLKNQVTQQQHERKAKAEQELADLLKSDYADFLSDINENKGKAQALEMFCKGDFIQSKEDMDVFVNIYNQIADVVKENAIKEYEAQKVINETKQKATIPTDGQVGVNTEALPTAEELRNTPGLYEKAAKKWGMERVDKILMKG